MKQGWVSAGDIAYLLYPFVPLSWLLAVARLHGRLQARLDRSRWRAVHENLSRLLADRQSPGGIDRMAREFFEGDRIRSLLIMLAPRIDADRMDAMFPIEGLEHLDRALERGKGIVLLGSHINSVAMFIAIIMLRHRGYPIGVALPEPGDAWARTRLRKTLDALQGRRIPVGEAIGGFYCQFNVRPIVERLRRGQIVAQTGDGWHSARFVEVEFLGRKLPFTTGSASLAQLTGASIVPIFQLGSPPAMRFVLEEPFTIAKGDAEDLRGRVAGYARRLEHHLWDNVPAWQHWLVPDALETMASWPRRTLRERYRVSHSGEGH